MLQNLGIGTIFFLIAVLSASNMAARAKDSPSMQTQSTKISAASFKDSMRKLLEDHITYTRLYIVSTVGNLPDKSATTQRLLQNQVDIGNAIKPYYGAAAGDQLTALLKSHILGAAAVLDDAKAGNKSKLATDNAAWFANADAIAAFLNKANPDNWPLDALKSHMHEHLNLTLNEATTQLKGEYPASIAAFDGVQTQILQLADALSSGIVKQDPSNFTQM